MKTKRQFAEQVLNELQDDYRNIDFKIDEREVFLRMDATVNEMAAKNYFDNWKMAGASIDEGFITTWEPVTVVDQLNGLPSYFVFPSNYPALPKNGGISEIYPIRWVTENQSPVVILSHEDYRRLINNPARSYSGRLAGYPQGSRFYFTKCNVKVEYGDMGVRLAVRDSSVIGMNEVYPIPSDKENELVATLVEWFRNRRMQPTDVVRDNKDAIRTT